MNISTEANQKDWLQAMGDAGAVTKDVLVNSRLLGHKRHPTITDVPFGSWTVTLVSDALEEAGIVQPSSAAEVSLAVGLGASLMAAAGGLADLSDTHDQSDRELGMMHGIFHGLAILLYGGSLVARRSANRRLGRWLGFAGYGTLISATYLAGKLAERRNAA